MSGNNHKVLIAIFNPIDNSIVKTTKVSLESETCFQFGSSELLFSSFYIRIGGLSTSGKLSARITPDVNPKSGNLYKAMYVDDGVLYPITNRIIHYTMLQITE